MSASAERISELLHSIVSDLDGDGVSFTLDRPKNPDHGDLASNVALTLASRLRRPPTEIAHDLAGRLAGVAGISRVQVAGPGFLNFFLEAATIGHVLGEILERDACYGQHQDGESQPIMVEFVSANPTGPLHLGHGRQAALGDAISTLLEWCGWNVHREFYFNDAGGQIDRLAASVRSRYLQLGGQDDAVAEDGYQGNYVIEIARALRGKYGDRLDSDDSPAALATMREFATERLRREQVDDLDNFGIHFDEFYPETRLYSEGRVDATTQALADTGLTYEKDGATWLQTTRFGDQKDRVMLKRDGSPTYFLPDVAYHMSKWERGFTRVVNVQGADHHSTVDRVRAGLQALGRPKGYPEYVLHQMVTVERGGEELRFSKRAGSYTTLAELVQEVGPDVARYFFLMRRPEAHLTFDLDVALDQSDKNPVYKVQYAHARLCSVFVRAVEKGLATGDGASAEATQNAVHQASLGGYQPDVTLLAHPAERELINRLAEFPATVRRAATGRAPHVICDFLEKTAGQVNSWYHAGNPSRNPELALLVPDPEIRAARLALAGAARIVIRNGLAVLGISAPERMERGEPDR